MTDRKNELLSDWLDVGQCSEDLADEAATDDHQLTGELVVHGLLRDANRHDGVVHERRIKRLLAEMKRLDEVKDDRTQQLVSYSKPASGTKRRENRIVAIAGSLGLAACLLIAFSVLRPGTLSSAEALERIIQSASQSIDRVYEIHVLEEYRQQRKPEGLSEQLWLAESNESVDGSMLYVGGENRYAFVLTLSDGRQRVSGCDGNESWAFREDGAVHLSDELNRFRGKIPGQQQSIAFTDLFSQLASIRDGHDIELGEPTDQKSHLGRLVGRRKSRDVRGPKSIELQFDLRDGTIHRMILDGLPRLHGGPKSVELVLVSQEPVEDGIYSHEFHHDGRRRIKRVPPKPRSI